MIKIITEADCPTLGLNPEERYFEAARILDFPRRIGVRPRLSLVLPGFAKAWYANETRGLCSREGGSAHGIVRNKAKRGVPPSIIRQGYKRLRTQNIPELNNKSDI